MSIVEYLIHKGCNTKIKNTNQNTPVHVACLLGHLPVIKYFIDNNYVDKDIKGQNDCTLLHFACKGGYLPIVEYLIDQGCDPQIHDKDGNTPVHLACLEGHLSVVKYLIIIILIKTSKDSKKVQYFILHA